MFGFLTGFFKKKEMSLGGKLSNRLLNLQENINKLFLNKWNEPIYASFPTELGIRHIHIKKVNDYGLYFEYAKNNTAGNEIIKIKINKFEYDHEFEMNITSKLTGKEIDLAILEIEEIVKKDLENRSKQYV